MGRHAYQLVISFHPEHTIKSILYFFTLQPHLFWLKWQWWLTDGIKPDIQDADLSTQQN